MRSFQLVSAAVFISLFTSIISTAKSWEVYGTSPRCATVLDCLQDIERNERKREKEKWYENQIRRLEGESDCRKYGICY
jgi:hypothetical protein